jgi:NAD(P)-dependent dehydrogenase (short-subunit alcohol dehydrogenase family)
MELSGKLAIVTGTSRGIGRALAIELAKSSCSLLLTALEGVLTRSRLNGNSIDFAIAQYYSHPAL